MNDRDIKVVCFGEILWDNLPSGKKPGGAPMNVAYHLKQLGIESLLISRVGNDDDGNGLLRFLNDIGVQSDFCQMDQAYPTSTVEAIVMEDHDIRYDIRFPVAWDFIQPDDHLIPLVSNAGALVFGSLSSRNNVTRKTLFGLLEASQYKVLDINLREPYYTPENLTELLTRADLVKLNSDELKIIAKLTGGSFDTEQENVKQLQDRFRISEVLVTKGIAGASYYNGDRQYDVPSHKVAVKDTVGSGDSFLAAFLAKRCRGNTISESLNYASALAGFVTSHYGACPSYTVSDLDLFMNDYKSVGL